MAIQEHTTTTCMSLPHKMSINNNIGWAWQSRETFVTHLLVVVEGDKQSNALSLPPSL